MNYRVKIIKRDPAGGLQGLPLGKDEKTLRQSEREIASTVKNWVVEFAQQRDADEHGARTRFFAAIH